MPRILYIPILILAGMLVFAPVSAQQGDMTVVPLVSSWNVSSVTSGNAVLASDFKPTRAISALRISVVLGSSAPLSVRETNGTQTFTSTLNGGANLAAGAMYTFTWEARQYDQLPTQSGGASTKGNLVSLNFVVGSGTTVPILRVTEVSGAVD